ncbi:class I SAM-dependent methyltransferase [Lysobacter sp. CA196]|uniref:class I SAM-dependent methyltransferase n=1 Tax=Lysobacter sp. CA196 TaxID=3455606 RepID=UPI003F8D768E
MIVPPASSEELKIVTIDVCSETTMYTWERHLGQTISGEEFEDSYRGQARSELTGLFSADRKLLLDIGCASGATSALLKQTIPGLVAWGVEPESAAAAIAAQRIDKVFAQKLEDIDLHAEGLSHGSVDAVLLADVLEHMYDPWRALLQIRPFLAKNAEVVISIPNVRNITLISDLVDGRFDYQKWGLLDITHIRFFTLDGAIRMLQETGYGVRHVQANVDPPLSGVLNAGLPADGSLKFDRISISNVEPRELVELCALQFFIKASPVHVELVGYGTTPEVEESAAEQGAVPAELTTEVQAEGDGEPQATTEHEIENSSGPAALTESSDSSLGLDETDQELHSSDDAPRVILSSDIERSEPPEAAESAEEEQQDAMDSREQEDS